MEIEGGCNGRYLQTERCRQEVAMSVGKPRDAEGVWKDLKKCMLSEAVRVCGETKGISRHKRPVVE